MPFNQTGEAIVKRIPVAVPMQNRSATATILSETDSILENCYFEKGADGDNWVVKWPGYTTAFTYNAAAVNGQGITYFKGLLLAISSNVLYLTNGNPVGSASLAAFTQTGIKATAPWFARHGHSSVVFLNKLWIVAGGGVTAGIYGTSDVWNTLDGVTWNQVAAASPFTHRWFAQLVVLGDTMYLIGGQGGSALLGITYNNDVWSTKDGSTWTQIQTNAGWTGRAQFGAVVMNNGIFIFGGQNGGTSLNDVWFSNDGITWTQLTANAGWSIRNSFGCAVYNNLMWVVGGWNNPTYYNQAWSSPDGITWTQTSAGPFPLGKNGLSLVSYNGKLWSFCGQDSTTALVASVHSTTDGITWTAVTTTPGYSARTEQTVAVFQLPSTISTLNVQDVWVMGGTSGADLNDVWIGTLNTVLAATASITTSGATTEQWQFETCANRQYLVGKNTFDMYYLYAGLWNHVNDPNYPARTVPGVVTLDSTVYVMDVNGVIYGSFLENPSRWSSLNFITADYAADDGIAIAKQLNYIVAFKRTSIQFFYDAGNLVGSPLSPVLNATVRLGCAIAGSIAQTQNSLIFMSQSTEAGRAIHMLNGLTPQKISNQYVDRILNADTLATVYAFPVRVAGHNFYCITLKASNLTLVYDFDTKEWHTRTSDFNYFKGISVTTDNTTAYVQDEAVGKIYAFSPSVYSDSGNQINVTGVGDIVDFDSNTPKTCSSLTVIGDRRAATSSNMLTIFWSNDDYQTFNAGISVDLTKARPKINRLGQFQRRAHKFVHIDTANPMRIKALELTIEPGDV